MNDINILSTLMILLLVCSGCTKPVSIRPVNIKVIDSVTKAPLENVPVYYVLQAYSVKNNFLFLTLPEPKQKTRTLIQEEGHTDKKGEISFKKRDIILDRDENLYEENIYINLDIHAEKIDYAEHKNRDKLTNFQYYFNLYATDSDKFYTPMSGYKGFQVKSTTWGLIPEDWGGTVRDKFDVLFNSQGLLKSADNFIIELKRK